MAAAINFTKSMLERLQSPSTGRLYLRDMRTPNLTLAITANGVKSFYLYKRINGQPERVLIGRFPDLTVEQARKAADRLRGEIAEGKNPADRKRTARGMMTLSELFDLYLEYYAKAHKRTWGEDQRQFDCHLADLKGRRLSSITKADVTKLHAKIGKDATYAANRLRALLSAMFNKAIESFGYEGVNPCKGVVRFQEEQRDRFLLPDELKRFFKALADEPDEDWQDFFKIVLLTGARRGNCQSMRWGELDLSRGEWRIPADKSKNRKALFVRLAPQAVEILNERLEARKESEAKSEFVFPSHGKTGHITEPKSAWDRIRTAAKLPGLRMHDLRRTMASWQAMTGASLPLIGKSLGHRTSSATTIYARLSEQSVNECVDRAATAMLSAGGVLPTPVVAEQRADNGR